MADKKQKIYNKKLVSAPVTFGFSMAAERHMESLEAPAPPPRSAETTKVPLELQREADRLLLARYAPPAVVINDQLEILQSRGRTGPFLELPAGKASLNLLKMARPGLIFELQKAIDEARKNGVETIRENIHVDDGESTKLTTVRVIPFRTPLQEHNNFLTVFEPAAVALSGMLASSQPLTPAEQSEKDNLIAQLRQEVASTKDYLQSIIESQEATNEELQSANEEIQSGNEELQSTNEELQTSKEELESANEELHTVNEEMQHRNELLSQLNNDLTNLLNTVNLPMVMVGADLSVRRFTSQATTILGLMPTDVGRPIPRLKLKIDSAKLEQMMLHVMQEVQPTVDDVQDHEGKWCRLRITPYRTLDNRIEGVVLTILNSIGDANDTGTNASTGVKSSAKKARKKANHSQ
jgi:two-component system CheB/CheR fusion protein